MANIVITLPRTENREEKKYTLEFTRRTIIQMEEDGIIKSLGKGVKQEVLDNLVRYACLKNHPNMTKEEAMEIIDSIGLEDLKGFVEALSTLLEKSINALNEAGKEGNARWEVH